MSVTLSSSVRSNLNELQTTLELISETSERVSTGLKVSSPLDDATSYYAAESYTDQAEALTTRLDGMDEATSVINSADNGVTTIESFLEQMEGIIEDALATDDADERRELGEQFNELISQIYTVAQDSDYGGTNLLSGNNAITVQFAADSNQSTLTIEGIDISADAGGVDSDGELGASSVVSTTTVTNDDGTTTTETTQYALTLTDQDGNVIGIQSAGTSGDAWEIDWGSDDYESLLNSLLTQVEDMSGELEIQSSSLSNNLSIITTRQDYTETLISILEEGAANLTETDLNEDAALLTSLETSASLATQTLSLASQNAENALTLLT